ncbi:MAG: exo-alpha-sialidase [Cytophagales bacterium]|nr:exo-alpha-sialidase [Cytophagales bacterium]
MKSLSILLFVISIYALSFICPDLDLQSNIREGLSYEVSHYEKKITNEWGAAETKKLNLKEFDVFSGEEGFAYNHHPQITFYKGKLLATWSSGIYNEDEPGQVMMLSISKDEGASWSNPTPIFDKKKGEHNNLVYTSEGILVYGDTLVAFCGVNDSERYLEVKQDEIYPKPISGDKLPYQLIPTTDQRTEIKTSIDGGLSWSESKIIIEGFIPNLKPVQTKEGRYILPGNMSFPYNDGNPIRDPWVLSPVDGLPKEFIDAPRWFQVTQKQINAPFEFCEASVVQMEDGTLKSMLRTDKKYLAVTWSKDNGDHWSEPQLSDYTDCGSRFEFGRLPDGRYFGITCPEPKSVRTPMILAISEDGVHYNEHFILGDEAATTARISGRWKYGRYGYPSYLVKGEVIYVVYSVNKEDIRMVKFPLSQLN